MTDVVLNMIFSGWISVTLMFCVLWLIHIFLKNAGVVDVGWGLGFIILCVMYIIQGEGFNSRNTLLFVMVALWGLRITLFLIKRLASDDEEDRRYQKIRKDWGQNIALKFFFFFEFQGVLQIIISIPFIVVSLNPDVGLSLFEILGATLFFVSLVSETISDEQLHAFKKNPDHKGLTCDVGLWRYSRHPNYFFEWMIWVGLGVYALGSPLGWVAIISPMVIYYLVVYVSGVPLAEEQSLRSRGENYRRYQETTSVFFPMPKRKVEGVS